MIIINMTVGRKIRSIRQSKNISQAALARKAGIAQSTLSYIENGKKTPQFETLASICKALEVSMLELLTYDETDIPFKLLEQDPAWQCILAADWSADDPITGLPLSDLPPDAAKDMDAFEKYLLLKYYWQEEA